MMYMDNLIVLEDEYPPTRHNSSRPIFGLKVFSILNKSKVLPE